MGDGEDDDAKDSLCTATRTTEETKEGLKKERGRLTVVVEFVLSGMRRQVDC